MCRQLPQSARYGSLLELPGRMVQAHPAKVSRFHFNMDSAASSWIQSRCGFLVSEIIGAGDTD